MSTLTSTETQHNALTAADRIQRVLDRLESGEELCQGYLREGNKFCIIGMFLDESDLGNWHGANYTYHWDQDYYMEAQGPTIESFYGFISPCGRFDVDKLPAELLAEIRGVLGSGSMWLPSYMLMDLSDDMLRAGVETAVANDILAKIIRSGVIFTSPLNIPGYEAKLKW